VRFGKGRNRAVKKMKTTGENHKRNRKTRTEKSAVFKKVSQDKSKARERENTKEKKKERETPREKGIL